MNFLASLCLLALASASITIAQDNRPKDPNQYFVYPGLPGPQWSNNPSVFATNENITYGVPMTQPFKWTTNTSVIISMYQEGNPESVKSRDLTGCTTDDFTYWDGQLGPIDIKNGSVFFLGASNCTIQDSSYTITSPTPAFFSHYFNLTLAANVATSSISSSAASPTTSTATTDKGGGSDSNSNATDIGAGVGGGLGGALALVGVAFLFIRHRNKQKERGKMERCGRYAPSDAKGLSQIHNSDYKYHVAPYPQELPARSIGKTNTERHEVP